ncbi:MAG: SLBB domain-containing protein [Melioribacteraceae bacterium]|nr:SLBB domain-containing protein [Melioribacteraceae bacterium]MCF8355435.1 SLBB domain-containing protein [Melioribacteraceae bacterium]MCF8395370.1 SLBB domain-containing protein [Melioribacteraceae bacterium]MCF8420463.1 SLBB domain-containing protein [Melioribacteraceae bacterium]
MRKWFILFSIMFITTSIIGQVSDYELGSRNIGLQQRQGGYFDYSDPNSLNIKVSVWGFVRYPGRYVIPSQTSLTDFLSYAGGPGDDAHLDDLRIYRMLDDSTQTLIKFNINDIWWEDSLKVNNRFVPKLTAGDMIVVPGSPRFYFKDWFSIALSLLSAVVSLTILIKNW